MRVRTVLLTVILLGVGVAQAAVPEAVRQTALATRGADAAAPPPADTWYVVEMDSLLAAVTRGDLGALRLVDDAGEPVAGGGARAALAGAVRPTPVDIAGVTWTAAEDDRTRPRGRGRPAAWRLSPRLLAVRHRPRRRGRRRRAHARLAPAGRYRARARASIWQRRLGEGAGSRRRRAPPSRRPDLRLERLTLRADRVRRVPFVARPGTFRGTTYEQVIDLPAGPHAVLSAVRAPPHRRDPVPGRRRPPTPRRWLAALGRGRPRLRAVPRRRSASRRSRSWRAPCD